MCAVIKTPMEFLVVLSEALINTTESAHSGNSSCIMQFWFAKDARYQLKAALPVLNLPVLNLKDVIHTVRFLVLILLCVWRRQGKYRQLCKKCF